MGNVPLTGRLLPGLILLIILVIFTIAEIALTKKSVLNLLKERKHFAFVWVLGLLFLHLFFTQVFYAKLMLLRICFLIFIILFSSWTFVQHIVRRRGNISRLIQNISTLFFSILIIILALECVFIFPARTHGYAVTFANSNWYNWYGGPQDQEGFRERDISETEFKEKKLILFLGDSFLEGSGIKKIEDRFSGIIHFRLKEHFVALNRGVGGSGTMAELKILREFKRKLSLIILSWIPNDPWDEAEFLGRIKPYKYEYQELNPIARFFIRHSYFLNFIYWSYPHSEFSGYYSDLMKLYKDKEIMHAHLNDILQIKKRADSLGAPLVVMLWPLLQNPEGSGFAVNEISDFLISEHIQFLDLTPYLKNYKPEKLMVNKYDAHPNEIAHRIAGVALFEYLMNEKLVK